MKKVTFFNKSILLILLLTFDLSIGYCGGEINVSKCRNGYRSQCKATTYCPAADFHAAVSTFNTCTQYPYSEAEPNDAYINSVIGAEQFVSYSGYWGPTVSGKVYKRSCSRGFLRPKCLDMLPLYDDATGEETMEITTSPVEYDSSNHKIHINDITGTIFSDFSDYISYFKITVWQPEDDEDTIITEGKTKWIGLISYENGNYSLTNFSSGDFSFGASGDGYELSFEDIDKELEFLGEDVTTFAVRFEFEGYPDEEESMQTVSINTEKNLKANNISLNTFPNPATDLLNVEYKNPKQKNVKETQIYIYDSKGVILISSTENDISVSKIKIPIAKLSSGTYFVQLIFDGQSFLKKFVKN